MPGYRKELSDLIRPKLAKPPGMTQELVDSLDALFDRAGVARDDGAPPKLAPTPGAGFRKELADLLRPKLAKPPGLDSDLVKALDSMWDRCGVPMDGAAKPEPKPAPPPKPAADGPRLADPDGFFAALKAGFGTMRAADQIPGIEAILAAASGAKWGPAFTANALATAWLETNNTMQPVAEAYYLKGRVRDLDAWRRKNLRYYPWHGRGYVQLTWERNYRKADDELKLGGTLVADPERALEADIAARIMARGMTEGWFTARKLADYLPAAGPGTAEQHKKARQIINGRDRWEDLAGYAMKFQAALIAGGWG